MHKQKKRFTKKAFLLFLAFIVATVLVLFMLEKAQVTNFFSKKQPSSKPTTAFDTSTPEEKQQDAATNAANKQRVADNSDNSPGQTSTPTSIDLSAKQEANSTVTIFTKLYGYGGGTCNLLISKGSATFNQTAPVIYSPEYSTCAGFSVPIPSLGSGDWTIKLDVISNGLTSTKTIAYKVL